MTILIAFCTALSGGKLEIGRKTVLRGTGGASGEVSVGLASEDCGGSASVGAVVGIVYEKVRGGAGLATGSAVGGTRFAIRNVALGENCSEEGGDEG